MKKRLTLADKWLVEEILNQVMSIMSPDDVLSEGQDETIYSDGGEFLYSMSEIDFKRLEKILNVK